MSLNPRKGHVHHSSAAGFLRGQYLPWRNGPLAQRRPAGICQRPRRASSLTAYHWGVAPAASHWGPKNFYERYKLPIYMTENGMSNIDWVALDGKVHDPQRIDFLHRYLLQLPQSRRTTASISAAISSGRCWIISNGPAASASVSASSTPITRPRNGYLKILLCGIKK